MGLLWNKDERIARRAATNAEFKAKMARINEARAEQKAARGRAREPGPFLPEATDTVTVKGTSMRQAGLARYTGREAFQLVADVKNPVDRNAVAVMLHG